MIKVFPIIDIPHVTDGDTLWVRRLWSAGEVDGVEMLGRDYAGGIPVRLAEAKELPGLNTPEKKNDPKEWARARSDLQGWVSDWVADELEFHWLGTKSFDRWLGDIVPREPHLIGEYSALAHMRDVCGWPAYRKVT